MKKKGKNIFVTIILIGLAVLLGYYVVNGVMDHLPEQEETPVVELQPGDEVTIKFTGDFEYELTVIYEDGIVWNDLINGNDVVYHGYVAIFNDGFDYKICQNGREVLLVDVIDFTVTYELVLAQ